MIDLSGIAPIAYVPISYVGTYIVLRHLRHDVTCRNEALAFGAALLLAPVTFVVISLGLCIYYAGRILGYK